MLNSAGTESKYGLKLTIPNSAGIIGSIEGESVFAETTLRLEIINVGGTFVLDVEGQLKNSPNWYPISTITGAVTGTLDISTYDRVRYNVITPDGTGLLVASAFMLNSSSSGGGATAANQVIGNNRTSTSLLSGLDFDDVQTTFPSAVIENYEYFLATVSQANVEVTYTDATKKNVLRARRI